MQKTLRWGCTDGLEKHVCVIISNAVLNEERIARLSATFRYRELSGEIFESLIVFLHLLLAVALDRNPAWRRVLPFNHLSFRYTLINHKSRCLSHVISNHRPGDPRQTAVSDLPKVVLCLRASRSEHSTWLVRAKQHNHSATAVRMSMSVLK